MYYVYIHRHKVTEEVVYCGKGSGFRYCGRNSRSKDHAALMREEKLEYIILRKFDDEEEAYIYEEKITESYKKKGQCKFNISIGRKTSDETKEKLSKILRGQTRSKETRERIKKNHARHLSRKVSMFKDDKFVKSFSSSREAGKYATENGVCSYGWVGRSLKTGEKTKPTKDFPIGGYRFVYKDDKMNLGKTNEL